MRRFGASGAPVAVIDARGALEEGLAATRMLGQAAAGDGRALLVLVSHGDVGALPEFRAGGATHFLASPMREIELLEALRFAERHAERVSGGWVAEELPSEPLGWRYDHARRSLQLTPALAGALDLPEEPPARRALEAIRHERPIMLTALRKVSEEGSAAFAHDLPGIGRVVEHIQRDARTGRLHALLEPLGETPDAGAAMRDVFPRRTRSFTRLAEDLPNAMASGEIEVLFQPQVDCTTGRIIGVEALARWQHGRLGEVGALALFSAAKRAGLLLALSAHVQMCALTAAARWPAELGDLRLSVNITAEDVSEPEFVQAMLARIDASGFARERVTLEVTESGLIESLDAAAAALQQLREAGCRIAADDFGTGYSSLAYLAMLPLDTLKLDKGMTHKLGGSARDRVVVRGILAMARSLGLTVVAEGIETEEQLAWLTTERCDIYQGYLCAPPIDTVALTQLVAAQA